MEFVKVHNIKGTSDRKPKGYNSWKDFWIDKTGRSWKSCCAICNNNAEVGAHVQKDGNNTENYWYIIPLCKACNAKKDSFLIWDQDLQRLTDTD